MVLLLLLVVLLVSEHVSEEFKVGGNEAESEEQN